MTAGELADAAEEEATLVIGSWQYVGIGWLNEGRTALATAAAARAREFHQHLAAQRRTQA